MGGVRQAGNGKRFGGEWRRMVCSGLLNRDFNRSFASISRAYMEISDMPKDGQERGRGHTKTAVNCRRSRNFYLPGQETRRVNSAGKRKL